MKLRPQEGFSVLEIIFSLTILIVASVIAIKAMQAIDANSTKSVHINKLLTLDSKLQLAIENSQNYQAYESSLKAGNLPANWDFNFSKAGETSFVIANYTSGTENTLYFDSNLAPCTSTNTARDCPYFTKLIISDPKATPPPYEIKIATVVGLTPGGKNANALANLSTESSPFIVPSGFFDSTKILKCPDDGVSTYLGIHNYDLSTGTVNCWKLGKKTCTNPDEYPIGLEEDPASATNHTLNVKCTSFYKYNCPENYSPSVFYPVNPALQPTPLNLSNACISLIKKDSGSPHLGHAIASVDSSKPPASATHYGLRWLMLRVCSPGYTPINKSNPSKNFQDDLKNLFEITDSIEKVEDACTSSTPLTCGSFQEAGTMPEDGKSFYCDMCPYSMPAAGKTIADGCDKRPFANGAPTPISVAHCTDPKIFSINSSAKNNITSSYKCELIRPEKTDGIPL